MRQGLPGREIRAGQYEAGRTTTTGGIMITYLYPLWLFFTAFFFYFAYVNWRQSTAEIREFSIRSREEAGEAKIELESANKQFVRDFNDYLGGVNQQNTKRHRGSAVGYALAGVFSLISLFMMLFS
jgi:hypothetical protein